MDFVRRLFSGIDGERLDRAIAIALKRVEPPKTETYECTNTGEYNGIPLPKVPAEVTKVADQSKAKLSFRVLHQQVIGSRYFKAPVIVEYVTVEERKRWETAVVADVRRLVE